jgi:DNA-binding response OmpR family regulator
LQAEGLSVVSADSAEEALEIMKIMLFDAIVLDRMMPGMNGVEFLKKIRAKNIGTPVLMLTALGDTDNAISGLEAGADDYMGKPFSLKELILRVRAMLKRGAPAPVAARCKWSWEGGEFMVGGRAAALSESEKKTLRELTTPPGAIAQAGPMTIKRLREKLAGCKLDMEITTVHGKGYRITKCA